MSLKDAASSTKGITRSSVNCSRTGKSGYSGDLLRSSMNGNTLVNSFFFYFDPLASLLFFLPVFLYSKLFQND